MGRLVGVPFSRSDNWISVRRNCEKPQSRQTSSFANTRTPGLSMFSRPRKWTFISEVNSVVFIDPHELQVIAILSPHHMRGSPDSRYRDFPGSLPGNSPVLARGIPYNPRDPLYRVPNWYATAAGILSQTIKNAFPFRDAERSSLAQLQSLTDDEVMACLQ